jgi:hypothetical protein
MGSAASDRHGLRQRREQFLLFLHRSVLPCHVRRDAGQRSGDLRVLGGDVSPNRRRRVIAFVFLFVAVLGGRGVVR